MLITSGFAEVPRPHVGLEEQAAVVRFRGTQPRDPLGRFPVRHARIVQSRRDQHVRVLRRANILVRTFEDPLLANCVRITVGRPADNDLVLEAVSVAEQKGHA